MHKDKFFTSNQGIKKEDWDRIFKKETPMEYIQRLGQEWDAPPEEPECTTPKSSYICDTAREIAHENGINLDE